MGKVEIEIDGKIARIYLNRPKVLNAIDTELPSLLSKAVKEAGDNDDVHVIILSGRGDAFCAGYDLTIKIPTKSDLPFLFVVSITGLTAHLCMTKAFSLAPVSVVMPIDFVRLPLISVVGYLFYNEVLTWYIVLGSILVFVGNYINIKAEERGQSYERVSGP